MDRIGQKLGSYRLVKLLGRGGFADVYLGEHVYLKNSAAIKILHARLASEDTQSFLVEARTLVQLIHPRIIRLFDFGVDDDTPFLVMDYAPNGTLLQRHPKGTRLPVTTVVDYVKQLAEALQYAHGQKLIHRDVKPANMLLGRQQEILLSDFGIALIALSSRYQSTQDTAGTIAYMAPEQILAHPRPASDQYSLGIVVYEWLCGTRPFTGTFTEISAKHMHMSPPSLREKLPELSIDVEKVVLTTLAKDPKDRFLNVKAFATALEQASRPPQPVNVIFSPEASSLLPFAPGPSDSVEPVKVSQEHLPSPSLIALMSRLQLPQLLNRRYPRRTVVAGVVGAALVGGAIYIGASTVFFHSSQGTLPGTLTYEYTEHKTIIRAIEWSPDGKSIASGSNDTTVQIWNASTGATLHVLSGPDDQVFAITWSPHGDNIVVSHKDGAVLLWTVGNEKNALLRSADNQPVHTVGWSPDGNYIASSSQTGTSYNILVWNAISKSEVSSYSRHTGIVEAVAWSPDSTRIASAGDDHIVRVWDVPFNSSDYQDFMNHTDVINAVRWSPDGTRIASASADKMVLVWKVPNKEIVGTYSHPDNVLAVVWSPDGTHIASGCADGLVRIWDVKSGKAVYTYQGHKGKGSVNAVAWSPDSKYIASGGDDTTVQVWLAG